MTFTTSNGSSKEVPCHYSDGYSWIVIQRRYNGSILFNRTWAEYESGFGDPQIDLWLGNFFISELTNAGYTVLKIDLISFEGDKRRIEYNFQVENQTNKYKLHISERNFSGIDSFTASNLEMFSTFDNDNDKSKAKNCAVDMFSGWWYADHNACTEANLNGVHWPQLVNDKRGVTWVKWKGTWSLKETRMMIRKP
ncbi:fibrinogen-like protein 1 [Crassostrea angulata]|uniref:fibrinogen-like protein 1 n=1 Tax=Magallana angulata TaxID=2784310 RepID=UPI0022B14839|nr:fibrinogen-like protein 1 [Crassostrea angulata]